MLILGKFSLGKLNLAGRIIKYGRPRWHLESSTGTDPVPYRYRTGTRAAILPSPTSNFCVYTCPELAWA